MNRQIIWDRKDNGGFPEAKVLKQIVRDIIAPTKNLGHSESPSTSAKKGKEDDVQQGLTTNKNHVGDDCVECYENENSGRKGENEISNEMSKSGVDDETSSGIGPLVSPHVRITYCTGCRWMLRSAWVCQELLSTFEEELTSVTLVPNTISPGTFVSSLLHQFLLKTAAGSFLFTLLFLLRCAPLQF